MRLQITGTVVNATEAKSAGTLYLHSGGRRWAARLDRPFDLSIPLTFGAAQPAFFDAPAASATVLEGGGFVGDVRRGGSCNCASYSLIPHCNGTHTECVGHITEDPVSIRDIAIAHFVPALLISVHPQARSLSNEDAGPLAQDADLLITESALVAAAGSAALAACKAIIIRTLPNTAEKLRRNYSAAPLPPYFTAAAMRWMVSHGIEHVVVDVPSLDRSDDGGKLAAHRVFWGMAPGATDSALAQRRQATVTEMAYIDAAIPDGPYLLNLQVAPFATDAAPSRPILYALEGQ